MTLKIWNNKVQNLKYKKIIVIGEKMPWSNFSSSQKSSADKKVKVAGPSNQHCHSSYITKPYKWIWTKNKNSVLDAPTCVHLRPSSSTFVHLGLPVSTFVHLHPHASICIYRCPPVSTCVQLRPAVSSCVQLCPPASTWVNLSPPASTFIHLHPLLFTCVHMHPLLSTCVP